MKRSKIILLFLVELFLLFWVLPWPCYSAEAVDVEQIKAWAQGKQAEDLTLKLIWLGKMLNKLDTLYQTDKADWMKTNAEVKNDLMTAQASLRKSTQDFEIYQTMQKAKMEQIEEERKAWRITALVVMGGVAGAAMGRDRYGMSWAAGGMIIGGAFGFVWGLVE